MNILLSANVAYDILSRKKIISALKKLNHKIATVAIADGNESYVQNNFDVNFYSVQINTRKKSPLNDLKLLHAYKKIYKKISPDLILHFGSKPDIYGGIAAKHLNIPTISNVTGLGKAFEKNNILSTLVENLYKRAFKYKKNFVFFQNEDDRNLFLQKKIVKKELTGLLPGSGVDLEYFTQNPTDIKTNKQTVQFAFYGRLLITKGARDYIKAAEIIKKNNANCIFHLAGSYTEKDKDFISKDEIEIAEKKGIIKYHGYIKNIKAFLEDNVDCLVFPSYYREGVPRALLEAAAMKKPLIAANSVGTKEPLEDGINGYLVEKNNIDDLAKKIFKFIKLDQSEKIQMGEESRRIAETKFSDTIIVEKYLKVIKEMFS